MLHPDPSKRPSALECLSHPWIAERRSSRPQGSEAALQNRLLEIEIPNNQGLNRLSVISENQEEEGEEEEEKEEEKA